MIWGWEIAVYLFLGGLAAGSMILASAARVRRLVFVAPVALSAGMLALFLDLESKLHVFRFYTAFRWTSPMSWGAWILLAIYPVTILYGLRPTENLRRASLILGIALGAYTGILLGTLSARAAWDSLFLAPLFLASGLSAAAALAMLLPSTETERDTLRRWDILAIALELIAIAFYLLDVRGIFLGGPYTAVFWSLVVIAGLAVPLFLEVFESRRHVHAAVAPVLVLIGGLSLRWILVLAGQTSI